MKVRLLKKVRKGCRIEKRGDQYRFVSKNSNYEWTDKYWAFVSYRNHIIWNARNKFKPSKEVVRIY